jgi:hypothetical protein
VLAELTLRRGRLSKRQSYANHTNKPANVHGASKRN